MNQTLLIVLYFVIVLAGSTLQNIIGFGFTLFVLAFLPMMFGYNKAIALQMPLAILSTLIVTLQYRKHICWKTLLPLLIPTVVLGAVGSYFSMKVESKAMYLAFGFFLIAMAAFFFFASEKVQLKATVGNGLLMGVISGIFSGLFSVSGPTVAMYLLSASKDKEEYMGNIQILFLTNNLCNLLVRISGGALDLGDIKYILIGWAAMIAGIVLGSKFFKQINKELFKKLVYGFIGFNGLWIVVTNLH